MVKFTIHGKLAGLNEYISAERSNRYAAHAMKKQSESVVIHCARALGKWRAEAPVMIEYRFFEQNRRRDKDNVSGYAHKVIQDGLVRGGWLAGDGWKHIDGYSDYFDVDAKAPRIEVRIYERGE